MSEPTNVWMLLHISVQGLRGCSSEQVNRLTMALVARGYVEWDDIGKVPNHHSGNDRHYFTFGVTAFERTRRWKNVRVGVLCGTTGGKLSAQTTQRRYCWENASIAIGRKVSRCRLQ